MKLMGVRILQGDCTVRLPELPDGSAHCCVTSPPYFGLRDYGAGGQLGLEDTPAAYVTRLVGVFHEVRRVLRADGTAWLNLGDCYTSGGRTGHGTREGYKQQTNRGMNGTNDPCRAPQPPGLKPKDLIGIPWLVAFALQADGWYLRSEVIWDKVNAFPEPVKDRPTKGHETIFLLAKSERYYYDHEAVRESAKGGRTRNRRTVWSVPTQACKGAHFATFPERLIEPCVLAGCPVGGVVLDPFLGSGTTAVVAIRNGRGCVGVELNPDYVEVARGRIGGEVTVD